MPDNSKPIEVTKPAMSIKECRETATRVDAFVPDSMRAMRWCTWRFEETKWRAMNAKVPRHPVLRYPWKGGNAPCIHAKTDDAATFGTYEEALAALQDGGEHNGVGVFLGEAGRSRNLSVADIDWKKYTGPLTAKGFPPVVQALIDELDAPTELSVSGQGLHVFLTGSLDAEEEAGRYKKISLGEGIDLEVYQEARYIGVTGRIIHNPGWHDCQDQVQMLERMMRMPVVEKPSATFAVTTGMLIGSSDAAIQHACDTDAVFRSLWQTGLMPEPEVALSPEKLADPVILERYLTVAGDGNRRELRLLTKLAWYGLDAEQIDAAYRTSPAFPERAGKWDDGRGSTTYGGMSIETALRLQTDRYGGKLKAQKTTVDTEAVKAAYASRRQLLIDSIGTIRGTARGRLGLRELVDEILRLIGDGEFSAQGSDLRISTGGLGGLSALLSTDRAAIRDRLQFASLQGLIGSVTPGTARGDATVVLMPANPDDLLAISEGLQRPDLSIPQTPSAARATARRADQKAAGTLPERKPRAKAAPRPPTLHRARYVVEHVCAVHSYSNPELAAATLESIGMIRRCSGMMLSHGYVRQLPKRRYQAVPGAAENFAADLAAEHDRIRLRGAIRNEIHRANFYRDRLVETDDARWAQLLARSEGRLARLEAGESVRKVLAA